MRTTEFMLAVSMMVTMPVVASAQDEEAPKPAPAEEVTPETTTPAAPAASAEDQAVAEPRRSRPVSDAEADEPKFPDPDTLYSILGGEEEVVENGGYGAIHAKFSTVMQEYVAFMGARGAWLINDTYGIGGAGYGMVDNMQLDDDHVSTADPNLEAPELDFGYGGLLLEYTAASDSVVHPVFSLVIGAGNVDKNYGEKDDESDSDNRRRDDDEDEFDNVYHRSASVFVAEPSVDVDINIFTWMRLSAGVSYRFVSDPGLDDIDWDDLSSASGNVALKFGSF